MSDRTGIIPVVIRFVPYDQWFITHIALSWSIAQVKTWILAKCFQDSDTLRILSASLKAAVRHKARHKRSVSPITFASTRIAAPSMPHVQIANDSDGSGDQQFCDSDDDRHRPYPDRSPRPTNPYIAKGVDPVFFPPSSNASSRPSVSSQSSLPPLQPSDYSLLSFSTFHIMEDRYLVSWYNIRPHELLEVHPVGTIVRLPREDTGTFRDQEAIFESAAPSEYIQPYFQAHIKALRTIRHYAMSPQAPSPTQEDFSIPASAPSSFSKAGKTWKPPASPPAESSVDDLNARPKRKLDPAKTKFVWQDRWLIVREGMLSLCEKKEDIVNASHCSKLTSLVALRGSEHLTNNASHSGILAGPNWRDDPVMRKRIICAKFQTRMESKKKDSLASFSERDSGEYDCKGKKLYNLTGIDEHTAETGARDKEDSIWLVMDMMNETAFEHIMRILHRSAPCNLRSSFLHVDVSRSGSDPIPFSFTHDLSQASVTNRPSFSSLHDAALASERSFTSHSLSPTNDHPQFSLSIDTSSPIMRSRGIKTLKYPDWRLDAVTRARRVGLGYIGKGMEILMCGNKQDSDLELDLEVQGRRERPTRFKTLRKSDDIKIVEGSNYTDSDESSDEDDSSGSSADARLSSSETEWEGWRFDLKRQWTSIAEESEPEPQPSVDFSTYHLPDTPESSIRRRVYSDAGRPLSPLSLTIADLSAAALADDSALWQPLLRTPGAVTTSTVSVGRPQARKRSSTVTGNSPEAPKKEKTNFLGKSKNMTDDKTKRRGPLWKARPPSLQMSPPSTSAEDIDAVGVTARPRTQQPEPNSRPTSILRNSTTTLDLSNPPSSEQQVSFLQPPAVASSVSSGRSSPGGDMIGSGLGIGKKVGSIARGMSIRMKPKTKGS